MKRSISYLLVFVLGFSVCAFVLYELYGVPVGRSPSTISPILRAPGRGIAGVGNGTIAAAVERVSKSVVNIDTAGTTTIGVGRDFPDFLGGMLRIPRRVVPTNGQASGVIISRDGYVLTNDHVVADARAIRVTLSDGKHFAARVVGTDPKTDLAVLKIGARNLAAATFADSSKLQVGDWVIAIGNALGLGTTVTAGVVGATERGPLQIEPGKTLENAIQTDAAINQGNSGGALADINGNIVGINTAIASTPGGGNIGIGFAIPSNAASRIAEMLIKTGKVVRPWIGIAYGPINDDIRGLLRQMSGKKVPRNASTYIDRIYPGSPAAKAGLRPYDVVLEINGKKVNKPEVIRDEVGRLKPGRMMGFTIWRLGTELAVSVKVGEMPAELRQPQH